MVLGYLLIPLSGYAQIENIWALGDGEKVFGDNLNHPNKDGNLIWDGEIIHLQGLYNEVLAFQVILEAASEGVEGIEIAVDSPLNQDSGNSIGANTLKYGPSGTIEIFTQHYLQVENPTEPQWFYGSKESAPAEMTGLIPDALIPTDATPGRGGFPVEIGPSKNQGFWVDLHLPRDQEKFQPGLYKGNVQVLQNGDVVKEIPLEVILHQDYLPDENNTNIWLSTSNIQAYYPGMSREHADQMQKFEGHRHRIDVVGGFTEHASVFSEAEMNKYKSWLDGSAFTPANGYYGPGQGTGENLFPIGMYGRSIMGSTEEEVRGLSDLWVKWFDENASHATYFWYLVDEPGEDRYDWIKERANWVHNNPGPGSSLPVFTTTGYKEELAESIDIWAAYNGVEMEVLPEIRSEGGDHWFYNGNRPRYGSVILEGSAVDLRINSWILYKYNINTHFIWHGTHWKHNQQGPKGHLHQNVFRNPLTFINGGMDFGNGDGIIFYPGQMPFYPEEDRGLNKIIPSIRLKNIRRGQQDAEIMLMAEKKVGREKVIEVINEVVPKALSEVSMEEEVHWSERGDDYERVRVQLLELISN